MFIIIKCLLLLLNRDSYLKSYNCLSDKNTWNCKYIYIYIRRAYDKFLDFFHMGTFIDSTHMKL